MLRKRRHDLAEATLKALDQSLAIIELDMSGTILRANGNFLDVTGYRSEDVVGQHHRIFLGK